MKEDTVCQVIETFSEKFGYESIKFLNSKSTINLINLNDEAFNRCLNLFNLDTTLLKIETVKTIGETLLQKEFVYKYPNIYLISSEMEKLKKEIMCLLEENFFVI